MTIDPPRPSGRLARLAAVVLTTAVTAVLLLAPARAASSVTLLFFGTETCPYCQLMDAFLTELEAEHAGDLEVQHFEVAQDPAAQQRFVEELATRGLEPSGVPVVMLDDRVWVGFNDRIAAEVETAVVAAIAAATPVPASPPEPDHAAGPGPPAVGPADGAVPADGADGVIDVPFRGEVQLGGRSAIGATALIALVDGFNPCSLWVLTVLLAMVLNAGASRGRVAAVGGTFLVVTGLLYGAFIAGLFTILGFVEHLGGIRIAVAAIALFVGAVNVKDFVAYRRGLSFTIPDRFKPRIYRSGRAIRDPRRPLPVVLGITVAMAAGIALIELPCTAGFPVIWTGILRTQGVEGLEFAGLLGLYLLIYVLDELLLFAVVVATLQVTRFQETHGRLLKLVGGTVMIALGVVLLVAPELMESLGGATLVVLGAAVLALVIAGVQRLFGGGDDGGHPPPPAARPTATAGSRR